MSIIFISYRRADSQSNTDRIYAELVKVFGRQAIFKDVDDIPLGADFPTHLDAMIKDSKVVLVVIGRTWATIKDNEGKPRLDNPNDFVRVEVESALKLPNAIVIPVLVNGATMPSSEQLSESLQSLLRLNAIEVRNDPDFANDIERLIRNLQKLGIQPKRSPLGMIGATILIVAIIIAGIFVGMNLFSGTDETPETLVAEAQTEEIILATEVPINTNIPSDTPVPPTATGVLSDNTPVLPTNIPFPAFTITDLDNDAELITFSSDRNGNGRFIYIMNSDGSNIRQFTTSGTFHTAPEWSPNKNWLAFIGGADVSGEPVRNIYVVSIDGSGLRNITQNTSSDIWIDGLSWSPDGGSIVFRDNREGDFEIYVIDVHDETTSQLTHNDAFESSPDWSINNRIVFSNESGIITMNTDGTDPVQLTDFGNTPKWSPDGNWIAYEYTCDIYIMSADGLNHRNLADLNEMSMSPSWSADGNQIVFMNNTARCAYMGPNDGIYVINADGSNLNIITADTASDWNPTWGP